jgi:Glycosyl hydrolases family 15
VSALALNGRYGEARALFERLLALSNDLGLFAEEYDVGRKRQVGNFPQAFSHLALIQAAGYIDQANGTGARPVPLAVGRSDPAPAAGDDMEEDQPLRAGVQHARDERSALPVDGPGLGVLGSQEDGAFEPQPLEGLIERLASDRSLSAVGQAHVADSGIPVMGPGSRVILIDRERPQAGVLSIGRK